MKGHTDAMGFAATLLAFGLSAGVVLAQDPPEEPPLNRTLMNLDDYKAQVDLTLPTLDPGMLTASTGIDWFASVDVTAVATAMDDLPEPDQIAQSGPRLVARDVAATKYVKLDSSRGRIRYANQTRRFDYSTFPHTAVPTSTAEMMVQDAIDALGIPVAEWGSFLVTTIKGKAYDDATQLEGSPFDRERVVLLNRLVNGYPVYGSIVRGSVSNQNGGEHAHFMVDWPRFLLQGGLSLRARQDVVDEIAERIYASELGAEVQIAIELGYARAGDTYLPVAKAAFSDPLSGEILFVPIVDVAPDVDLDGVPDSTDNCVERPNPGQEDADGDGVGNLCDNCPNISNLDQSDANGDGFGDVCQPEVPATPPGPLVLAALFLLGAGIFAFGRLRSAAG